MVASLYYLDRTIWLSVTSVIIVVCILQIFASRSISVLEMKHLAHYIVLFNTLTLMICFIDIGSVWGYIPHFAYGLLENFCGQLTIGCVCLVIISHFRAHYLSLQEEFPSYLTKLLIFPITTGFLLGIIADILIWKYDQRRYLIVTIVSTFYETGFITILDLIGYYKIRKLLIGVMELSMENNKIQKGDTNQISEESYCLCLKRQTTRSTDWNEEGINHRALLTKIWKFHVTVVILAVLACFTTGLRFRELTDLDAPYVRYDPEVWTLNYPIHLSALAQFLFLWWSWIPLRFICQPQSEEDQLARTHIQKTETKELQTGSPPDSPSLQADASLQEIRNFFPGDSSSSISPSSPTRDPSSPSSTPSPSRHPPTHHSNDSNSTIEIQSEPNSPIEMSTLRPPSYYLQNLPKVTTTNR